MPTGRPAQPRKPPRSRKWRPAIAGADLESYYAALKADRRVWPVKRRLGDGPGPFPPTIVRFRDIADPKSVEQVDPDDLAKSFGPGVKLKSLTVQMTDEPVTTGIEKRLGWLAGHPQTSFRNGRSSKCTRILAGLRQF